VAKIRSWKSEIIPFHSPRSGSGSVCFEYRGTYYTMESCGHTFHDYARYDIGCDIECKICTLEEMS